MCVSMSVQETFSQSSSPTKMYHVQFSTAAVIAVIILHYGIVFVSSRDVQDFSPLMLQRLFVLVC